MTVLRISSDEYASPRRRNDFAGVRRRGGISMQYYQPVRRDSVLKRCVIAEKKHPLPAFSSEGIRLDVLVITLALALLLFVCVLSADLEAVVRGGKQIGKLNAGITMLEADNSYLREQISRTASQSFLVQKAADEEPERIVILSPAPAE